jgi:nitric oxide reductase NorE protein
MISESPDLFRDPFATHAGAPDRRPRSRWEGRGHIPGEVGIWIFVIWDMTWFAVLFAVFLDARAHHLTTFERGRLDLTLWAGTLNTLLLLTGSLLVALAVGQVRAGEHAHARRLLGFALLCGAGFVVNKLFEYLRLVSAGHQPGGHNQFFTYFFVLTGIHLVHLLVGLMALTYMRRVTGRAATRRNDIRNIEICATYWHLVDLLWVALFALLYLLR